MCLLQGIFTLWEIWHKLCLDSVSRTYIYILVMPYVEYPGHTDTISYTLPQSKVTEQDSLWTLHCELGSTSVLVISSIQRSAMTLSHRHSMLIVWWFLLLWIEGWPQGMQVKSNYSFFRLSFSCAFVLVQSVKRGLSWQMGNIFVQFSFSSSG